MLFILKFLKVGRIKYKNFWEADAMNNMLLSYFVGLKKSWLIKYEDIESWE